MLITISILNGLLLTFIILLFVYGRIHRKKTIDMLDWFLLSIALFYGVGMTFVFWSTYIGRNPVPNFSNTIMNYDVYMIFFYFIYIYIFSIFVILGFYFTKSLQTHIPKTKKRSEKIFERDNYIKKMYSISWLILMTSFLCYWLYTYAYGGFVNYLDYSRAVRSGVITVDNHFSFLQRFGALSYFSSFIFFSILIDKSQKFKFKFNNAGFILSILFSIYVLYSWVGRVGLAIYISTFFLGYILYISKSILPLFRKLIIFSVGILFLIVTSDVFLGRSESEKGILEYFTKELSFPFYTYHHIFLSHDYRWLLDVVISPIYLFPMRVWSGLLDLETASSYNTFLILGARKGDPGVYGEVPIDTLSFSILQGGIFGIVVCGILWGSLLFWVQRLLNKIKVKSIRNVIEANIILNFGILSVLYGDPQHIIVENFYMIVSWFITIILLRVNFFKVSIY